jgi:hypothetical protein
MEMNGANGVLASGETTVVEVVREMPWAMLVDISQVRSWLGSSIESSPGLRCGNRDGKIQVSAGDIDLLGTRSPVAPQRLDAGSPRVDVIRGRSIHRVVLRA